MTTFAHRRPASTSSGSSSTTTNANRQFGLPTDFEDDFEDITPRVSPQRGYSQTQKTASELSGLVNTGWRRSSENEKLSQHRGQMNEKWHRKRRDITPRPRAINSLLPAYGINSQDGEREPAWGKSPPRTKSITTGPLVTQWHGRKRKRHLTKLSLYDKLVFIAFLVSFVVFLRALCGAGESAAGPRQAYHAHASSRENLRGDLKASLHGIDRNSLRSGIKNDPHTHLSVDLEGHYSFALDNTHHGHILQAEVVAVLSEPGRMKSHPAQSTPALTEATEFTSFPSKDSTSPVATLAFFPSEFASPTAPTVLSIDWRWADYERYGLDFPDHPVRIHLADQPIAQLPVRRGRHGVKARLGLR